MISSLPVFFFFFCEVSFTFAYSVPSEMGLYVVVRCFQRNVNLEMSQFRPDCAQMPQTRRESLMFTYVTSHKVGKTT